MRRFPTFFVILDAVLFSVYKSAGAFTGIISELYSKNLATRTLFFVPNILFGVAFPILKILFYAVTIFTIVLIIAFFVSRIKMKKGLRKDETTAKSCTASEQANSGQINSGQANKEQTNSTIRADAF